MDSSYQATVTPSDREAARTELEVQYSAVLALLEEHSGDSRVVSKARALTSSLYNIYKEARQSSRSAMC